MDKSLLIEQMKTALATVFSFYMKTHNYHWNVTGPNFAQYHDFLGDLYTQVWESVDAYAEHIRALGSFAPGSLSRFSELTQISDEMMIPRGEAMMAKLSSDNRIILMSLRAARDTASAVGEHGVVNFLEGQIDAHDKIQWQLDAFKEAV